QARAAAVPAGPAEEERADMSAPSRHDATRRSLINWTLSFLGPYRGRMTLAAILLLTQVALTALEPWPLKIVIDYVLRPAAALPSELAAWLPAAVSASRVALLIFIVAAGVVLQVINQFISAAATQVQVDTGQRMV